MSANGLDRLEVGQHVHSWGWSLHFMESLFGIFSRHYIENLNIVHYVTLYRLLDKPVTVACGHTFCQDCLARSFDHTPFCPVCRSLLSEVGRAVVGIRCMYTVTHVPWLASVILSHMKVFFLSILPSTIPYTLLYKGIILYVYNMCICTLQLALCVKAC